jgi:hypothetical protein
LALPGNYILNKRKDNMARSRNTKKENVWADERIGRTENGQIRLPRIIVRHPAHGDIHPLSRKFISRALRTIPVEYLYGLTHIELRARQGKQIGKPFGKYRSSEKAIILYSLPMNWVIDELAIGPRENMEAFGAEVVCKEDGWHVHWPSKASIGVWYFTEVLTHELGHHFAEQYKKKRGRIRGHRFAELNAELHSCRLTRELFNRVRRRRQERAKISEQKA